jgi:alkanesulfonate monooxygenase SsuD/methylene tetrahydromethanopterin reductase-like flavin-dependent oxidoreductase (luciferase family)
MRLSMHVGYAGSHRESAALVAELEQVGLDVAWIPEAYSYDAPSYMGYLAARTERVEIAAGILPLYTRTPSLLAMTAAGIDALSDGRCILGLGASGPQVIEGFAVQRRCGLVDRIRSGREVLYQTSDLGLTLVNTSAAVSGR